MHRSVSYYGLSQQRRSKLDEMLADMDGGPHGIDKNGVGGGGSNNVNVAAPPAGLASMPRSISLQRLPYHKQSRSPGGASPGLYNHNHHNHNQHNHNPHHRSSAHPFPHHQQHHHVGVFPSHHFLSPTNLTRIHRRRTASTANIELLDDNNDVDTASTAASGKEQPASSTESEWKEEQRTKDQEHDDGISILLPPSALPDPSSSVAEPSSPTIDSTSTGTTPDFMPAPSGSMPISIQGATLPIPSPSSRRGSQRGHAAAPVSIPAAPANSLVPEGAFFNPHAIREGDALLHTRDTDGMDLPISPSSLPESFSLPPTLVDRFEVVGRAGDSTCDSWIVRSKFSGKMAVWKPRDGEQFLEKQRWEEEKERREEEERRRQRAAAAGINVQALVERRPTAALSSSCPHPLSLPTHLRTPIKRGVVYGDTTRKEVAAYLMDHDHFAGVPRTVEATIWMQRHAAPNQGQNMYASGIENEHPYFHHALNPSQPRLMDGKTEHPHHDRRALKAPSPDMRPQPHSHHTHSRSAAHGSDSQPRLMIEAGTNSPSLNASDDPQFPFDAEEEWARGPGGGGHNDAFLPPPAAALNDESNLSPPAELLSPPTIVDAATANGANTSSPLSSSTTATSSPGTVTSNGSSPPDDLSGPLGLSLPKSSGDLIATYGSLQEFVNNNGSAEDMGSSSFSTDEVHRIGILDVRLLNLDRHLGNLLVQHDPSTGEPHLVPIDHGYILPSYQDLADVHLEWTHWRQCQQPFSPATLRYIARLDPVADAAKLRSLGIPDEGLVSMVFSSLMLQQAAKEGLNLYHIAQMVQRGGDGEEPSVLETIVARVLGCQQQANAAAAEEHEYEQDHVHPTSHNCSQQSPCNCNHTGRTRGGSQTLASVQEENNSSPTSSSNSASRQSSATMPCSACYSRAPTPPISSAPSPPVGGLLTRSNSDGAMALAEAINRQSSAPAAASTAAVVGSGARSIPSQSQQDRPRTAADRRKSVVEAATEMMQQIHNATSHSPQTGSVMASMQSNGNSKPSSPQTGATPSPSSPPSPDAPASSNSVSGPPSLLRLGTELSVVGENGSSLQHAAGLRLAELLHLTQTVIKEELDNYRKKHGLLPPTPEKMEEPLRQRGTSASINRKQVVPVSPSLRQTLSASPVAAHRSSLPTSTPPRSQSFDVLSQLRHANHHHPRRHTSGEYDRDGSSASSRAVHVPTAAVTSGPSGLAAAFSRHRQRARSEDEAQVLERQSSGVSPASVAAAASMRQQASTPSDHLIEAQS